MTHERAAVKRRPLPARLALIGFETVMSAIGKQVGTPYVRDEATTAYLFWFS